MNIALIGYRGTGKSVVGKLAGKRLGMKCIGMDARIVEKAGKSIPEIVEEQGWTAFRDLESEVVRELTALGRRDSRYRRRRDRTPGKHRSLASDLPHHLAEGVDGGDCLPAFKATRNARRSAARRVSPTRWTRSSPAERPFTPALLNTKSTPMH